MEDSEYTDNSSGETEGVEHTVVYVSVSALCNDQRDCSLFSSDVVDVTEDYKICATSRLMTKAESKKCVMLLIL